MKTPDVTAIWRECVGADTEFVGPVAPPMWLWLKRGSPKDAWEIATVAGHVPLSAHKSIEPEWSAS